LLLNNSLKTKLNIDIFLMQVSLDEILGSLFLKNIPYILGDMVRQFLRSRLKWLCYGCSSLSLHFCCEIL